MIKSILFRGKIKGNGVVNFDSLAQRSILWERFPADREAVRHKNVKIAKHSFYKKGETEKGDPIWEKKLNISADCLRNAVFSADFPFQNTIILHHPDLLIRVIGSVAALLRGYMYAAEGKPALKRKSPMMITAAEQSCNGASSFEVGTMSGAKRTKDDEDETGDTSLHYEEKIGSVEYEFEGALDLGELQFISFSQNYDRLAVLPDYSAAYRQSLSDALGSKVGDVGFYIRKEALIRSPEEGILLTQGQVARLVEEFFRRLMALHIQRAKSYATLAGLEVKFVSNPLEDTFANEGGWKKPKSPAEAVPKANDIIISYEEISEKEAKQIDEVLRVNSAAHASAKKSRKQDADAKAAAKKATRSAKKSSRR
jgi:hypothetical protein